MNASRVTWAALATLGLALVTPGTAAVAAPYATCSGLAVHSIANNLPIFDRPYITSPRLETVQRGDYLYCAASGVRLGDRYDACGVTRANGWVAVHPSTGDGLRIGYAYMTCMRDG